MCESGLVRLFSHIIFLLQVYIKVTHHKLFIDTPHMHKRGRCWP